MITYRFLKGNIVFFYLKNRLYHVSKKLTADIILMWSTLKKETCHSFITR